MKLIVGLGNPGPQYESTRHNLGFRVIDVLASRWNIRMNTEKFHAWFGSGVVCGAPVVLLKPTTYMNLSGRAVLAAGRFYKLELSALLVISDDLALPLERMRMRRSGSAGGHLGLQDVIDRLGSKDFCRLRLGVSAAADDAAGYVLSPFSYEENRAVEQVADRAADAVQTWIVEGVEAAMNRFNVGGREPE